VKQKAETPLTPEQDLEYDRLDKQGIFTRSQIMTEIGAVATEEEVEPGEQMSLVPRPKRRSKRPLRPHELARIDVAKKKVEQKFPQGNQDIQRLPKGPAVDTGIPPYQPPQEESEAARSQRAEDVMAAFGGPTDDL